MSDTQEPVAWAVTIGPPSKVLVYEAFAAHQKDEAIELADKCRFGDTGMELPLAPLYFAPTLTDEEREAVAWAALAFGNKAEELGRQDDLWLRLLKAELTLRNLLARLS
jgi:hypothetical protein